MHDIFVNFINLAVVIKFEYEDRLLAKVRISVITWHNLTSNYSLVWRREFSDIFPTFACISAKN